MSLISAEDQSQIRLMFDAMTNPVKVVLFVDKDDCTYCDDTGQIVDEVAALSPKITVERHDRAAEPEVASLYGVDKTPAIAIVQESVDGQPARDFGVRFYGIPSGYEFVSLLEDIVMVSKGETDLSPTTKAWLATLQKPVHVQVFVTPTCPYCPSMVKLAHKLAVASPLVRADGVEATEFPELSDRFGVYGVPRTVISVEGGKDQHIEGAVREDRVLAALQKAVGSRLVLASN